MSEFPFWVSSLALALSEPVCSPPACQLLYLSALSHTLPLFYCHTLALSAYSLALLLSGFTMQGRVVSWIIYACLCSCRRRRWLSQKHSDRGIVSARGTLENQCSSLPRRVRLCSKPSTDCIPLSLTLRKNVKRTEIQQLEACSKANLWIIAHDFQKLKQNTQNRNTKYTSYFHLKHTKTNTARKLWIG